MIDQNTQTLPYWQTRVAHAQSQCDILKPTECKTVGAESDAKCETTYENDNNEDWSISDG